MKPLYKYFYFVLLLIGCLIGNNKSFGQQISFASLTGGVNTNAIPAGSTKKVLYGFSVTATTGSATFKRFYIGAQSNTGTLAGVITNGTLYRSPTASFNPSIPGIPVGNVTFGPSGNTSVTINDLNETVSSSDGSAKYYFLVADALAANTYAQLYINYMTVGVDVNNVSYSCQGGSYIGVNYGSGTPYRLSVTNLTTDVASASDLLTPGTTGIKLFQFSIKNNSASETVISGINVNSNVTIGNYLSNIKIHSSSSASFPVSATATGTPNGTYVSFAVSQTIAAGATQYYWVVADCPNNGSLGNIQLNFNIGQGTNAITTSTPASGSYNTFTTFGRTYTISSASVAVTSQQNGISNGALTAGQSNITLFGFGVSASSNISVSQFNINSNGPAESYFGNARLYRNTTNNYTTGTKTLVGTATFNGTYCNVVFSSPEAISSTETYYFLVADNIVGQTPNPTIAFNFTSGQSTDAVVQTNPASSYNIFNITGNTFTIPSPTLIYSNNTNYTASTTIAVGQSAVLSGFNVKATGTINITSPYLDFEVPGGDASGLFPAAGVEVWVSTSGTFETATKINGTNSSNGASGLKITLPSTLTFTAGVTYSYYIVGKLAARPSLPLTRAIGANGFISDNSANDFPTSTLTKTSFNLISASVTITGNNSAAAGITQGALSYGQRDIVLFSFKLTAQGAFTISKMSIPSTTDMQQYFNGGRVYRSTTPYFTDAQLINGVTIDFKAPTNITGLNQVFTAASSTTYYYFIVADFLASTNITATTVQYNFSANQATAAINYDSGAGDKLNGFTTTDGAVFTIATVYKWKGTFNGDFSDARNFTDVKGNNVSVIGPTAMVEIGVETFTNAPSITAAAAATTTIGGITFGALQTATLNIAAGKTLILNNSLSLINGATGTISGDATATVNIASGASSALNGASTLNITGGVVVNNSGTFTVSPTSALNVNGGSTLNNAGTFTLQSNALGSASIGPLANAAGTTIGTVTGTFNVERYITGGSLIYRGYRLLSSPVHSGSTGYYDLGYLKGSGTYLTGAGGTANGWDVAGNPTLYLYRPDRTPNNSSFTSGNYRPVTKINNTPNAYVTGTQDGDFNLGIGNGYLMFYRGNNGTLTTTIPNSLSLTASGNINQGDVQVRPWFNGNNKLDFSDSPTAPTNGNAGVKGFNLVGNPYPSTIDWNTNGASANSGIYTTNVATTIYVLDPVTQGYSTYNSTNGASTLNGSRYIPSGQGFFVLATTTNAQLTFREHSKVTNQVNGSSLLLNTAANKEPDRHIRVQLYKDVNIYDDIFIGFKQNASKAYVFNEDSPYKQGNGKVSFSTLTSDRQAMAINYMPLPAQQENIPLNFTVNGAGTYKLNTTEILNVPDIYDVWLHDNLTKDSLDIRNNQTYTFKTTADTASYGANRFKIVIRVNESKAARLLSFSGAKNGNKVDLTWTVENENDYTRYSLERSVDGGKTYIVIDSLTSKKLGTYQDIDPYPVKGLNQYRLKQIDFLGRVSYSDIVPVMYSELADKKVANNIINLYPNPVRQTLNLDIAKANSKNAAVSYKITVTNSTGYIVQTINTTTPNWQGNVSHLLPGTYFVQVVNTTDNTLAGKSTFIKL